MAEQKKGSGLLSSRGDSREKEFWPSLSPYFGSYESFWATYVLPLRHETGGHVRSDVDERLEFMAQANYKCFLSLAKALSNLENTEHPEVTYGHIKNAANAATATVKCFIEIARERLGQEVEIPINELVALATRVSRYRNFIHDGVVALRKIEGVFYIPKPDKLQKYRRWSSLKESEAEDFTPLLDDLRSEFGALCTIVDSRWKSMLSFAPAITGSDLFRSLHPAQPAMALHEYPIVCSSNVQEDAAAIRKHVHKL